MLKEKILTTLEEIKVISDPFRFRILVLFNEGDSSLTVKQMAVKLKEIPSKVHYHVKELERIGVLEIVETKEKGGVLEKFYLPTAEVFRMEKSIAALDSSEYHKAKESIFNLMHQDFIDYSKTVNTGEKYKEQLNYGLVNLTDEEVDQLGSMITEFLKNKDVRKGTKPYMFGYALFQKLEVKEETKNGNQD